MYKLRAILKVTMGEEEQHILDTDGPAPLQGSD